MYFDNKLTQDIADWLQTEPAERDIEKGATLLLKLNHNKILYQNAIRRPDKLAAKVEYELKKFYRMRLDSMTSEMVVKLDKELMPKVDELIKTQELAPVISTDDDMSLPPAIAKGKRDDHDSLPEDIRKKWDDNGPIFFKIKELHNTLKGMADAQPCDRYEYLQQLKDLDIRYHKNLAEYDSFKLDAPTDTPAAGDEENTDEPDPAEFNKKVSAARTYLSDNKKKLEKLKNQIDEMELAELDTEKEHKHFDDLLAKVQDRYDFLHSSGVVISDDQLIALRDLGLVVDTNED